MSKKLRDIKVNALSFHRAIEIIKKIEKDNPSLKISNKRLSKFLAEKSDYTTSASSIPIEVKTAILVVYGSPQTDPNKLPDEKKMEDFDLNSAQYISLTRRFNAIAKKHNSNAKNISPSVVQAADTVKDCIDIVTKAASFNNN